MCFAPTAVLLFAVTLATEEQACRGLGLKYTLDEKKATSVTSVSLLQTSDKAYPRVAALDAGSTLRGSRLEKDEDGGQKLHRKGSVQDIVPNDLWGIRDLLLIGYSAPFMKVNTTGARLVQNAALELARLLPKLHPYGPCRKEAASLLAESHSESDLSVIKRAAASAWSCLPANYNESSFIGGFSEDMIGDYAKSFDGRMPQPENTNLLGACDGSLWPRTCSYWSSLHLMAERADASGNSAKFMNAVVPIIAGGALLCEGCTLHFTTLHQDVLPKSIISDDREEGF
jgi:hypothetical protein